MRITPSPLCWPVGWRRTLDRAVGPFRVGQHGAMTIAESIRRLRLELKRFGVDDEDVIISTNLRIRLDGFPYSDQRAPADPGAAVYWTDPMNKQPRSMAVDRYTKVEQNIAALAATLDAMRAIERHGGATVIEKAFTGFLALPGPGGTALERPWWEVLEVDPLASNETILAAYKRLRSAWHPDKHGGNTMRATQINLAYEAAQKERDDGS